MQAVKFGHMSGAVIECGIRGISFFVAGTTEARAGIAPPGVVLFLFSSIATSLCLRVPVKVASIPSHIRQVAVRYLCPSRRPLPPLHEQLICQAPPSYMLRV